MLKPLNTGKAAALGAAAGMVLGLVVALGRTTVVYAAWRPSGSEGLLMLSTYLLVFCMLAPFLLVPCAAIALLFKVTRKAALFLVVGAPAFLVALFACSRWEGPIKDAGIARVIDRAKPLVEAITRYEAEKGRPPAELGELVPAYIAQVPSTGAGAFPEYHYSAATPERPGRWWLAVHIGEMVFDWKHLQYEPEGRYQSHGRRMVGDWAVINP